VANEGGSNEAKDTTARSTYGACTQRQRMRRDALEQNPLGRALSPTHPSQWTQAAPTLLQGYRAAQAGVTYLPQGLPLHLIGSEEVPFTRTEYREDWDKLVALRPGVVGVIEFTSVGFSNDGHEAILGYRYFHAVKPDGFREEMAWIWLRWGDPLALRATSKEPTPVASPSAVVFAHHWVVSHRVDTGRTIKWTPKITPTPISPARAAKATPSL
jgi:transposase InsO family protein